MAIFHMGSKHGFLDSNPSSSICKLCDPEQGIFFNLTRPWGGFVCKMYILI